MDLLDFKKNPEVLFFIIIFLIIFFFNDKEKVREWLQYITLA